MIPCLLGAAPFQFLGEGGLQLSLAERARAGDLASFLSATLAGMLL